MDEKFYFTSYRIWDRRKEGRGFYVVLNYKAGDAYKSKTRLLRATTKKEATKEAAAIFNYALENEKDFIEDKYRFSAYVAKYLDMREAVKDITPNTLGGYRYMAAQVCKELHDPYIHKITRPVLQNWVIKLQKEYLLSASSVVHRINFVHMVLKHAVLDGIIPSNPADGIKKPKRDKREINILEKEEVKRLFSALENTADLRLKALIIFGVSTGMRPAETCALRWNDIDAAGLVRIYKTVTRHKATEYVGEQTKTKAGNRVLYLGEKTLRMLEAFKAYQQEECKDLGVAWSPELYILGYPNGQFFSPHLAGKKFRAFARAIGLKGSTGSTPRLYDLRHTFATRALQAGVDIETIANSMGHANVAMTLNTYATSDTDAKKRLAQAMNDIF